MPERLPEPIIVGVKWRTRLLWLAGMLSIAAFMVAYRVWPPDRPHWLAETETMKIRRGGIGGVPAPSAFVPYDAWYLSSATESNLVARLKADGFRMQPHQYDGFDIYVKDGESVTLFLNSDLDVKGEAMTASAGSKVTVVYSRPKTWLENLYWKFRP